MGVAKRLEDRKLALQLDASALDWLAGVGYDPVYGARPLKRAIQRELETPIAKGILAGSFGFFAMLFLIFLKIFPVIAIAEIKELEIHHKEHDSPDIHGVWAEGAS